MTKRQRARLHIRRTRTYRLAKGDATTRPFCIVGQAARYGNGLDAFPWTSDPSSRPAAGHIDRG
jgi:hypothetical protein